MRALVRRLLLLAVVSTLLDGCIVVSDPDFRGQDECVPFFLTHEAEPSNSEPVNLSESTATDFRASVPLRSCALTLEYEGRVFIDGVFVKMVQVPVSGVELRNVPILVDISGKSPGCHVVDVVVSSNFADLQTPERSGDLTKISWLFYNDASTDVGSCGAL